MDVYDTLIHFSGQFNSVGERYRQNPNRNQGRGGKQAGKRKYVVQKQQQEEYLPEQTVLTTTKSLATTVDPEDTTLEAVHHQIGATVAPPAYKSARL